MTTDRLHEIVSHLISFPSETEWFEFKVNKADPEDIGEYISAISNAATLHHQDCGYLVWGVKDKTHQIVGN